jgi:hypothetical protein
MAMIVMGKVKIVIVSKISREVPGKIYLIPPPIK